ncbi:MAG TPA: hypothetical protein VH419_02925, partial [Nocardioidaceae bacterium]
LRMPTVNWPDVTIVNVGVLTPHGTAGADVEFEVMAGDKVSTRVAQISLAQAGGNPAPPTSPGELRSHAHPSVVDIAAAELEPATLAAIAYASTSSAYVIGPDAERDLTERLRARWSIPVFSTPSSAVDALRKFEVQRLAVVHPSWFGEVHNALGAAYFRDQGFTVVQAELADVQGDPDLVEVDSVVEWVSNHVDRDAEAVFLGGNGFRAAGAVAELEKRLRCLVLESNQVLLWSILSETGSPVSIRGFGRLFHATGSASTSGHYR